MNSSLTRHLTKFVAVGAVNTGAGYAVFAFTQEYFFKELNFGYLLALALSYGVAVPIAFFLYRRYVFEASPLAAKRQWLRFVIVYAQSIAVNSLLLPIFVELALFNPIIAQAFVLCVTTTLNYFGHRYFSFGRH